MLLHHGLIHVLVTAMSDPQFNQLIGLTKIFFFLAPYGLLHLLQASLPLVVRTIYLFACFPLFTCSCSHIFSVLTVQRHLQVIVGGRVEQYTIEHVTVSDSEGEKVSYKLFGPLQAMGLE